MASANFSDNQLTIRGLGSPAKVFPTKLDDQPPTLANDPDLTPEVKGVTHQDTIRNWDAPFPVDYDLVRSQDDDYWESHRTTPKAFLSLKTAERLWSSRFGSVTSFRVPANLDTTKVEHEPIEAVHLRAVRLLRPHRRKIARYRLPQPLGQLQVLEPMLTQIVQSLAAQQLRHHI